MDTETLIKCMPFAGSRAALYADPLTLTMDEFAIDTPARQAAFVAQLAHESGSLKYTAELADGSAYEGRLDLGNTQPGDGRRYRGRGLIQLTGRNNYVRCALALNLPLIDRPELLESPGNACRSAGWFWSTRHLNQYADSDKFGALTRAINGGFNGLDDRIAHWLRARRALGIS